MDVPFSYPRGERAAYLQQLPDLLDEGDGDLDRIVGGLAQQDFDDLEG